MNQCPRCHLFGQISTENSFLHGGRIMKCGHCHYVKLLYNQRVPQLIGLGLIGVGIYLWFTQYNTTTLLGPGLVLAGVIWLFILSRSSIGSSRPGIVKTRFTYRPKKRKRKNHRRSSRRRTNKRFRSYRKRNKRKRRKR